MPTAVAEILAHSATGIRRDVLQRRRVTGRSGYHDGILHGAVFFEEAHHLCHCRALLADRYVDADHARMPLMPVRLLVPGVTLIDDSIEGDGGLAGLAVTDDQFTLATANRHHGIDGLQPRLQWLVHWQAVDHAWGDALNRAALFRINGTLAVNGLPQSIHYAPNHRLADGHLHDTSSAPDFIALFNLRIGAK